MLISPKSIVFYFHKLILYHDLFIFVWFGEFERNACVCVWVSGGHDNPCVFSVKNKKIDEAHLYVLGTKDSENKLK